MISVIVAGRNAHPPQALTDNIEATIGCQFELVWIANNGGNGLGAAWNQGALKAKGDFLCFMHDDVQLLSSCWGERAMNLMGAFVLLGIAGSACKPALLSGWFSGIPGQDHYHVFHGKAAWSHLWSNRQADHNPVTQVVTLDGAWLFCRKEHWLRNRFNESLDGFHFYDLDFSLRSNRIGPVGVWNQLDILHSSQGRFDGQWLRTGLRYHRFAHHLMPAFLEGHEPGAGWEKDSARFWLERLAGEGIPPFWRWALLRHYAQKLGWGFAWVHKDFFFR